MLGGGTLGVGSEPDGPSAGREGRGCSTAAAADTGGVTETDAVAIGLEATFMEGLFKREVPELAQGSVVVKGIAREAGSRSKIAVSATQSGIDPVGSLVGQKGVRVQAVIQEFNGMEKIDIIQWTEDTKAFIANALSPAKELTITVDEASKTAFVNAPADQLSIAIGKDGQNARLASKLTGWRIEIKEKEGQEAHEETEEAQADVAA